MNEQDFRLLSCLNHTKNITRAADLLYITQSALSKRITSIEEELGTKIMLRSQKGIHFTPEGEEVLRRTEEAARCMSLMREELDRQKGYVSGTLKAGISINYALYELPDILAVYRQKYPHVNTRITTDQSRNLFVQMMEGTIDVAIVRGEYPWKEHRVLLNREKICAIYSSQDRDKPLSQIPYIERRTDPVMEREIAQWMREQGLKPQSHGICTDNIMTCVEMVSRGVGWAIVPEICLKNFPGHVQPLFFNNGEPFIRSVYLLYSDLSLELPQAEAFIRVVRSV